MKTNPTTIALCAAVSLAGAAAWFLTGRIDHTIPHPAASAVRSAPAPAMTLPTRARSASPSAFQSFDHERLMAEISTTTDPAVLVLVEKVFSAQSDLEKGDAADSLAALGTFDAVANLLRIAGLQETAEDRALILDGLKNLSTAEGFRTLASMLSATRDAQFLDAAVEHLSRASAPEVLDTLVELYRERNDLPFQKNQALRAIAAQRHPDTARRLAKLASTAAEPALAEAATTAWHHIRNPAAAE